MSLIHLEMSKEIKYCGSCGTANAAINNFCNQCGKPFALLEQKIIRIPKLNESVKSISKKITTDETKVIQVPDAGQKAKEILTPEYKLLQDKLIKLNTTGGTLDVYCKDNFVRFIRKSGSYALIIDLGSFEDGEGTVLRLKELGYSDAVGRFQKVFPVVNLEEVIFKAVEETKMLFESILNVSKPFEFIYEEHYDVGPVIKAKSTKAKNVKTTGQPTQNQKDGGYGCLIILIFALIVLIFIGYCNRPDEGTKASTPDIADDKLEASIDLNKFSGQKITFKSGLYDNELNGVVQQTHKITTYHTFDFINMTVTQKSPLDGKWVTVTYPINGIYQENGLAATTYVIKVGTLGVKEIWFSPDVPNIGYDYDDGTRIACYQITKE